MDIKEKLREIVALMDPILEKEWGELLDQNFGFNQRQKELVLNMLDHAKEHNLRPAKRLRASLVYWAFLLNSKFDEKIFKAMAAVEFVHTGLLMHDDFMDRDAVRRGKPTTHVYFAGGDLHHGESMAVNIGDLVFTHGFRLLLNTGFAKSGEVTDHMLSSIVKTAYGQAFDVHLEKYSDWNEEDVIALHKAKTAIYTYENPLYIGAILGGCKKEILEILSRYSMEAGVAFQLQDDVLGVFGDSEKTGKSDNSDLLQGKRTLLVLKALGRANGEQKADVMAVWGKQSAEKYEVEKAKLAIKETGSLAYSMEVSVAYAKRAQIIATELYPLCHNKEAVDYLVGVAQYMVEREF